MTRNATAWIGLSILVATGAYLSAGQLLGLPISPAPDELARLASGVALLIVIGGSVFIGHRGQPSLLLKQALVWIAIFLTLMVIYMYRADLQRLGMRMLADAAINVPALARVTGISSDSQNGVVAVSASRGGHFALEALINGTSVRLLADTGATLVALTHDDALRIGIDLDGLRYNVPVQTANGVVKNALLHVDEIQLGSINVRKVRALIAKPGQLETSLLGMSFLSRLASFQISGSQLILRE